MTATASATGAIAAYSASTSLEAVPIAVREQAKLVAFDELCCAVFGRQQPAGILAAGYVKSVGGAAEAHVLGGGGLAPAPYAALVNGTSGHADEIDGAHVVGGHPGATLVHAALAAAELQAASGAEFLNAVILGYDIGVRMISACGGTFVVKNSHHLHADFLHALGATVACCRLLELPASAYPHALALATFQANGLCALFTERRHISKALCNGQYAFAGVSAALMARAGLEGADDVLGTEHGLFEAWGSGSSSTAAVAGLGTDYAIMQANFKFVRAGYPIHAALEAASALVARESISIEDVEQIEVGMPEHAMRVVDNRLMHNICLQDMLSVALLHNGLDLATSYFPDIESDERFQALRQRVVLRVDPQLQVEQPNGRGARVTITTTDGRVASHRVDQPRGHSARGPVSWEDLVDKWQSALPGHDVAQMAAALRHVDDSADMRVVAELFARGSEAERS